MNILMNCREEQPKIIVIAPKRYNERIKEFLDFNQYDLYGIKMKVHLMKHLCI